MAGLSDIINFVRNKFSPQEREVVQERDYTPEIASATEMGPIPEEEYIPSLPIDKPSIPEVEVEDISAYREHLLDKEGFKTEAYKPTGKPNEPWTIGVGYTGPEIIEGTIWSNEKGYEKLDEGILERLPILRTTFENFDNLPESVRVPMLGSWYRGSLSGSPLTIELINQGKFKEAADEFLDNEEYEESKTQKGIDKGMRGIGTRMEEFSAALQRHGEEVQGKATGGMVMRNPYNNYNKQRII